MGLLGALCCLARRMHHRLSCTSVCHTMRQTTIRAYIALYPASNTAMLSLLAGLRRKGAMVADGEVQRIMAHVDLDGNNTLDFQVSLLPEPLALSPAEYVCWMLGCVCQSIICSVTIRIRYANWLAHGQSGKC